MKKIRTVLIEDEGAALRRLEKMATANTYLEIVGAVKTGEKAIKAITELEPDLVILDIELKDMDAFEVIQSLPPGFSCQLIFITAFSQYAVEAFEIMATDYLMKPYDLSRFNQAVKRVKDKSQKTDIDSLISSLQSIQSSTQRFEIIEGTKIYYFSNNEVIWIEADGYYCKIHKSDGSSTILRKTLKDLTGLLPSSFRRVNRSAIINLDLVERKTVNISQQHYYLKGGIKIMQSENY